VERKRFDRCKKDYRDKEDSRENKQEDKREDRKQSAKGKKKNPFL